MESNLFSNLFLAQQGHRIDSESALGREGCSENTHTQHCEHDAAKDERIFGRRLLYTRYSETADLLPACQSTIFLTVPSASACAMPSKSCCRRKSALFGPSVEIGRAHV